MTDVDRESLTDAEVERVREVVGVGTTWESRTVALVERILAGRRAGRDESDSLAQLAYDSNEREKVLETALTEAILELTEARSFIAAETRHYPTVGAINERIERLRGVLGDPPGAVLGEREPCPWADCPSHARASGMGLAEPRRLPGDTATCQRCREPIIWAVTTAKPSGPGGKPMPLDPIENPSGNVAAQPGHGGRILARVLGKDERHSPPVEYLAMPHFATCGKAARL